MTCGCAQRELHARPLQIRCDAITEDGGRRKRYCGGEQPHVSLARHQDFAVQIGCTANTKGSYTSLQRHAHNSPALQYVHLVSIIHVDHVGITGISGPAAEPKRPLPRR